MAECLPGAVWPQWSCCVLLAKTPLGEPFLATILEESNNHFSKKLVLYLNSNQYKTENHHKMAVSASVVCVYDYQLLVN
jgi:hypothetical protein